jgi:hypothetical protein
MGKAAPTLPCDAGCCDADRDGQVWHTSSPPASPAAVGSPSVTQAPAWRAIAATSPNWKKMHALAEDRNAEPALGRMPHLRATLSPVSWLLATPAHPLRDAVDILDEFDFVDIPAAGIRSVHTPGWVRLADTCSGRTATVFAQAQARFWNRGASWQAMAGQLRDAAGDRGLEHACNPPT